MSCGMSRKAALRDARWKYALTRKRALAGME
jgi:hypothetical protein